MKLALPFLVSAILISGCANVRPVIHENGGGGVQVSTEQSTGKTVFFYSAGFGAAGWGIGELIDSAGNDNIVYSQNRENPKSIREMKVRAEAVFRRRK